MSDDESSIDDETLADLDQLATSRADALGRPVLALHIEGTGTVGVDDLVPMPLGLRRETRWNELHELACWLTDEHDPAGRQLGRLLVERRWEDEGYDPDEDVELAPFVAQLELPQSSHFVRVADVPLL